MNEFPVLVLFNSVHESLKMEDLLESQKILYRTVIKPRDLGPDCGVAIALSDLDLMALKTLAARYSLKITGIHKKKNDTWEPYE